MSVDSLMMVLLKKDLAARPWIGHMLRWPRPTKAALSLNLTFLPSSGLDSPV